MNKNKMKVTIGQLWKIKPESLRVWRDNTMLVVSVKDDTFKDAYNREWNISLLEEHYTLVENNCKVVDICTPTL